MEPFPPKCLLCPQNCQSCSHDFGLWVGSGRSCETAQMSLRIVCVTVCPGEPPATEAPSPPGLGVWLAASSQLTPSPRPKPPSHNRFQRKGSPSSKITPHSHSQGGSRLMTNRGCEGVKAWPLASLADGSTGSPELELLQGDSSQPRVSFCQSGSLQLPPGLGPKSVSK